MVWVYGPIMTFPPPELQPPPPPPLQLTEAHPCPPHIVVKSLREQEEDGCLWLSTAPMRLDQLSKDEEKMDKLRGGGGGPSSGMLK